jgi:release factor glutamine methyltransferase
VDEVTFDGLQLLSLPGRVMTPRVTSERLVEAARAWIGDSPARVVDVGTGSGAIAIAIAVACPLTEVWATDNSRSAVALARANVRRHGLAGRVSVRQGDLLSSVPGQFDFIVANLPYLPAASAADHPELGVEPFEAVFATGDGLAHYRRLVGAATTRLAVDGLLLLQLHRQVVATSFAELPALRAALATPAAALARTTAKEAA